MQPPCSKCDDSVNAVQNAMLQWRPGEIETVASEAGLPFAMLHTIEEFMKEIEYTEVLSKSYIIDNLWYSVYDKWRR